MKIQSKLASVLFKLVIFVAAALGVLLSCHAFGDQTDWSELRHYAVFANALCAIFYFTSAICGLFRNRELQPRVRGGVILLLCVLTVCDLAYDGASFSTSLTYLLLHIVTVVLTVFDWLLFGEKNHYCWRSPVFWMILPNLFFAYVILRVKFLGGSCMWGFLDYRVYGVWQVLLHIVTVNVFSFAVGYLFVSMDMLMAKRKKKRKKSK